MRKDRSKDMKFTLYSVPIDKILSFSQYTIFRKFIQWRITSECDYALSSKDSVFRRNLTGELTRLSQLIGSKRSEKRDRNVEPWVVAAASGL